MLLFSIFQFILSLLLTFSQFPPSPRLPLTPSPPHPFSPSPILPLTPENLLSVTTKHNLAKKYEIVLCCGGLIPEMGYIIFEGETGRAGDGGDGGMRDEETGKMGRGEEGGRGGREGDKDEKLELSAPREVIMNERVGRDVVGFAERYFDIYGEFEGMVYHRKRNGELEKYPYEPVSYYHRTALAIRNEWIRTYAARVSNPRLPEYREIIRKLNYYTPYIMSAGKCKFRGETIFYVRKRGDYEFRWQGSPLGFRQKVGKSTEVELSFGAEGEFVLECWYEDELYCERRFIITGDDIDVAYDEWLAANLEELLTEPEPEYESVKTYRRGLRSNPNWLKSIEGKYHEDVLYQVPEYAYKDQKGENPWLYHRRRYDHRENPQTQEFNHKIKEIGEMWQSLSQTERELWNRKAAEYSNKRWTGFNLFTREKMRE